MKHLALPLLTTALIALVCTSLGCTSNDKTGAGLEADISAPPRPAATAESRAQSSSQPNPAANGGFNLPATTPYQGSGAVTQNVNPAPFLVANQSQGTASSSPTPSKPAARKTPARKKK